MNTNHKQLYLLIISVILITFFTTFYLYGANNNALQEQINTLARYESLALNYLQQLQQQQQQLQKENKESQQKNYFLENIKTRVNQLLYSDSVNFLQDLSLVLLNLVLYQDGFCEHGIEVGGGFYPQYPEEGIWQLCVDKDKWVRTPESINNISKSKEYIQQQQQQEEEEQKLPICTCFSFGIANDFTFDDKMAKLGCRVESFDPSMTNMSDSKRSEYHNFWRIGISDENNESFKGVEYGGGQQEQIWKVYTLDTLMKMHNVEIIDYLKMDVEMAEWRVLTHWIKHGNILNKIRMLSFEAHFLEELNIKRHLEWIDIFYKLREAGFKLYGHRQNPFCIAQTTGFLTINGGCFDLYWYNSNLIESV